MSKPQRPATVLPVLPRYVTRCLKSIPADEDLCEAAVKIIADPDELTDTPASGLEGYGNSPNEPGTDLSPSPPSCHLDTPDNDHAAFRCPFQVGGYGSPFVAGRGAGDVRPAPLTLHPLLFFPL